MGDQERAKHYIRKFCPLSLLLLLLYIGERWRPALGEGAFFSLEECDDDAFAAVLRITKAQVSAPLNLVCRRPTSRIFILGVRHKQ